MVGAALRALPVPVGRTYTRAVGVLHQVTAEPAAPTGGGANLLQTGLNWTLWTGLILSAIAAVIGFGLMGLASLNGGYGHANHGKKAALSGLAGAGGCGIAIPFINLLFTTGRAG